MNTQSENIGQDNNFYVEPNKVWDERKIRDVEEEIELLHEQVKSLKRERQGGYELTYECLQELEYTNKEMELMNEEISNLINLKRLPIEQAKEWAKSIIEKKPSVCDALAELLSAIYGCPVNLNESEEIKSLSFKSKVDSFKVQSSELRANYEKVMARSSKVTAISDRIKARSREIRVCSCELKAHSREIRNQLGSEKISRTASGIFNLHDEIAPRGDLAKGS